MAFEANKVVTMKYTLKDDDGIVIDSTQDGQPFSFLSGGQQILPKLEEAVGEMIIGSKKTVKLAPADAYGDYDETAVQTVKKDAFPENTNLEVGLSYFSNTPDGQQVRFTITKVLGENITLDFNHPLAGRDLEFDIELLDVRDATPEEIEHGHVHGPGGHQH